MKKQATPNKDRQTHYRAIEAALLQAGWGGLRVAGVAKAISLSKSYAHKLLSELVEIGYVTKNFEPDNKGNYFVNYRYYQLPISLSGLTEEYDGEAAYEQWLDGGSDGTYGLEH